MNTNLLRTVVAGLTTLWLASCGGGAEVPATKMAKVGAASPSVTRSSTQPAASPETRDTGAALASGFHKPLSVPWPTHHIPPNLWQPPPGATPATGSYVYLESEEGDPVGEGRTYLYTPADSLLVAWQSTWHDLRGRYLGLSVMGDEAWSADFQVMDSLNALQVGLYTQLRQYPLHNPLRGGIGWSKGNRRCNSANGWVAIDAAEAPPSGLLTRIEMRFEQVCSNSSARLRGKVVWHVEDAGLSVDRVASIPAGVWRPPEGAGIPEEGNYVYLESDPSHWVGRGRKLLFTPENADISMHSFPGGLRVLLNQPDGNRWHGTLNGKRRIDLMSPPLTPGIYPVRRVGIGSLTGDDVEGEISWSGDSWACSSSGWFVIDHIVYVGRDITEVDARFEDFCHGLGESMRGQFRWRR
jgi:hypothetical protein